MKRVSVLMAVMIAVTTVATSQYARYFMDNTMRVDVYHTGTKGQETISLDRVYREAITRPAQPG